MKHGDSPFRRSERRQLTIGLAVFLIGALVAHWIVVVLVALARVYVGAHPPLDVIGGFALGVAVGAAVNLLLGPQEHEPEPARIA